MENMQEIIRKRNERLMKKSSSNVLFLVLTAGPKKKKFVVYEHESFVTRTGKIFPSKYDKRFIRYASPDEFIELLEDKKFARHLAHVEVDDLSNSQTADVPRWKFITWGKYKKTNVDEIATKDPNYARWLISSVFEAQLYGRQVVCDDLERYILGDEYRDMVEAAAKDLKRVVLHYSHDDTDCLITPDLSAFAEFIGLPVGWHIKNSVLDIGIIGAKNKSGFICRINNESDTKRVMALASEFDVKCYLTRADEHGVSVCFKQPEDIKQVNKFAGV